MGSRSTQRLSSQRTARDRRCRAEQWFTMYAGKGASRQLRRLPQPVCEVVQVVHCDAFVQLLHLYRLLRG